MPERDRSDVWVNIRPGDGEPQRFHLYGTAMQTVTHLTRVNLMDLADYVDEPIEGARPDTVRFETPQYFGTKVWKLGGVNLADTATFEAGKEYSVEVTLTAKEGYTFTGVEKDEFSHSGPSSAGVYNAADLSDGKVNIAFQDAYRTFEVFSNATTESDSAIDMIKAKAGGEKLFLIYTGTTETEEVDLSKDDIVNGLSLTTASSSTSPAQVVINGGGKLVVDLTGSPTNPGSPLITVGEGVTLTLKNITFKGLKSTANGGDDSADNTASLIKVVANGKLILGDGAVIRDNVAVKPGQGGGVNVAAGGSLTMKAGSEISHNQAHVGGGVQVDGAFTMEGGTIKSNFAKFDSDGGFGGGVCVSRASNGTMTMTGGVIYGDTDNEFGNDDPNNNTAGNSGDGHAIQYWISGGSIKYPNTIPNVTTNPLPFTIP